MKNAHVVLGRHPVCASWAVAREFGECAALSTKGHLFKMADTHAHLQPFGSGTPNSSALDSFRGSSAGWHDGVVANDRRPLLACRTLEKGGLRARRARLEETLKAGAVNDVNHLVGKGEKERDGAGGMGDNARVAPFRLFFFFFFFFFFALRTFSAQKRSQIQRRSACHHGSLFHSDDMSIDSCSSGTCGLQAEF